MLYVPQEEWARTNESGELIVYPSIVSTGGNHYWGSNGSFYLFYTYIPPGEGFNSRYLIRRKVDVITNNTPVLPQVKVSLGRYYSSTIVDHWITTSMVPSTYNYEFSLGYLFTKQQPGMTELQDCYWPEANDHLVVPGNSCMGLKKLRSLGWVWANPQPGTVPLYRCYWKSATDHFISPNNCGSSNPDIITEFIIGYVATS